MTKQQSAKRQSSPDGLHEFEAALRAAGREPLLEWAKEAPPGKEYVEHARYNVGPDWLYVQALREGGWRAFVGLSSTGGQPLSLGSILRFDTYKTLPAPENINLLSLIAEHPTAVIDRNVADYQAAEARLFPHG